MSNFMIMIKILSDHNAEMIIILVYNTLQLAGTWPWRIFNSNAISPYPQCYGMFPKNLDVQRDKCKTDCGGYPVTNLEHT